MDTISKFDVSCHEKSSLPRADLLLRNFVNMRGAAASIPPEVFFSELTFLSHVALIHEFGFGRCHKYRMYSVFE